MTVIFAVFIYAASMTLANLSIATWGPWVSPINAFVLIGLDLALRDWLHVRVNAWQMGALIASAGALTYALNPAAGMIAIASSVAFTAAALVDWAVFVRMPGSWLARANGSNVTGAGIPTVSPFHAEALFHGLKHGFDYMGMITIVTDVVRENNQTYRLGYTEMCKDATKMGVGSPEYVLLFHKPQTDRSRGYADNPVAKNKAESSLARWQVDAHAFWRSSGERLLTAEEMAAYGPAKLAKIFTDYSLSNVYDYEFHVRIGEELLERQALPSTFMSLAPGSHHPDVWHDINRMRTLNGDQSNRAVEKHICPLQFDIVDRLIDRYSNLGERIYDPFCGLGTVPYRAIKKGRTGGGSELNPTYFMDQAHYLRAAEKEVSMPSLFALEEAEIEMELEA